MLFHSLITFIPFICYFIPSKFDIGSVCDRWVILLSFCVIRSIPKLDLYSWAEFNGDFTFELLKTYKIIIVHSKKCKLRTLWFPLFFFFISVGK